MKITRAKFCKLTVRDIFCFNQRDTLFLYEFRGSGEDLNKDIYDMYLYENLSRHIEHSINLRANNSFIATNDELIADQCVLYAPASEVFHIPMIDRIDCVPDDIKQIWTAIPHPRIDTYCTERSLNVNYGWGDFVKFNDKILQKRIFAENSSKFEIINKVNIDKILNLKDVYVKSSNGSGGYKVFDMNSPQDIVKIKNKILTDNDLWFYDERVEGDSYSIQGYIDQDEVIFFGITRQILEGTTYVGSEFLSFDILTIEMRNIFLETTKKLFQDSPYEGFFGYDFIMNKNKISLIEANVRVTSATMPTLLVNDLSGDSKYIFIEAIDKSETFDSDIVISSDPKKEVLSVLRLVL